ncbi:DUF1674 domain-containing protein [Pseudoxanthomonas kalamensis DSM 18571]|nr:DUF1674 domain-containing protein [Pseudoxanthomonas kalamensis DSM 18571]
MTAWSGRAKKDSLVRERLSAKGARTRILCVARIAMIGQTPNPPEPDTETQQPEKDVAPKEIGGREGPEPTRYGDWEKNGRCVDF